MPTPPAARPWMGRAYLAADRERGIPSSPFGDGCRLVLVVRVGRRKATLYYPSTGRAWLLDRAAFDRLKVEPVAFSRLEVKRKIRARLAKAKRDGHQHPRRLMQLILERL